MDTRFGHGTGVLSCAVGGNVAGVSLGVAPGARWVACAGLPEGRYNNVLALDCADWMLTTAQPDVLLVAWSLPASGCDRSLQPVAEAWRAAEILPVFAAGNHGPAAGSARSPANYQGLSPGGRAALSIGGLARDRSASAETARGPGACGGTVFPLLVAPAEELVAAFPITPSSYLRTRGTSFAAGLAAGAAALLLERHPEASVVELEEALVGGASDLGPAGPDDAFGYGLPEVPGALARLDAIRARTGSASSGRRGWSVRRVTVPSCLPAGVAGSSATTTAQRRPSASGSTCGRKKTLSEIAWRTTSGRAPWLTRTTRASLPCPGAAKK